MSDYDAFDTPAKTVLHHPYLLLEIAQWHYRTYSVIARLNRAGGKLALDQSLYYRAWRIELKRRSVKLERLRIAGDDVPLAWSAVRSKYAWRTIPPFIDYCGPEPRVLEETHRIGPTLNIKRMVYGLGGKFRRQYTFYYDGFGWRELSIQEPGVTRSRRKVVKKGTEEQIVWFLGEFEKYRDGPFPPITE